MTEKPKLAHSIRLVSIETTQASMYRGLFFGLLITTITLPIFSPRELTLPFLSLIGCACIFIGLIFEKFEFSYKEYFKRLAIEIFFCLLGLSLGYELPLFILSVTCVVAILKLMKFYAFRVPPEGSPEDIGFGITMIISGFLAGIYKVNQDYGYLWFNYGAEMLFKIAATVLGMLIMGITLIWMLIWISAFLAKDKKDQVKRYLIEYNGQRFDGTAPWGAVIIDSLSGCRISIKIQIRGKTLEEFITDGKTIETNRYKYEDGFYYFYGYKFQLRIVNWIIQKDRIKIFELGLVAAPHNA